MKIGRAINQFHRRHRSVEFRQFLAPSTRRCRTSWTCTSFWTTTIVRGADEQTIAPPRPPKYLPTRGSHRGIYRPASFESQAVRLDQNSRSDPGEHGALRQRTVDTQAAPVIWQTTGTGH